MRNTGWKEASPDYFRPIEVILYRTGKKESAESIRVVINDTATYEMTRNAFYSFRNHAEAIKVCSDGQCIDIDLIKKRTNYIQCSLRDEGELRCERVSEKEGEFYSRRAQVLFEREKGSE